MTAHTWFDGGIGQSAVGRSRRMEPFGRTKRERQRDHRRGVIVGSDDGIDDLTVESGVLVDVDDVLTIHGALDNDGQIDVLSPGTIILDAPLATAGLGEFTTLYARLDFAGTLDNTGATFVSNDDSISGAIEGGTIEGRILIEAYNR